MPRFLISGHINIETTLRIESFPLNYNPVNYPFFGINNTIAGVGYNISKALKTLGNELNLLSLVGPDMAGQQVRAALTAENLPAEYVLTANHTGQAVIIFEKTGRRQIHTDLKNIQDQRYSAEMFEQALTQAEVCALCNINFSRPMLAPARAAGKSVATDVHALSSLDDEYNADFMRAAHVLFLSHERLPVPPEEFAREVLQRFGNEVVVIGCGGEGAVLAVRQDNFVGRFPAVTVRPIVNTIGAGDALFSAFLHNYARTRNPYTALQLAMVFAAWKIGATGAAEGFLTEAELVRLAEKHAPPVKTD